MRRSRPKVSYWEKTTFYRRRDVVIVGAGIVGINAAIKLKMRNPKWHVAVIDRHPIPLGGSTRNAGFACFGGPSELLADLQSGHDDHVQKIVELRWQGLQSLRYLLGDKRIDYQHTGGHEIFRQEDESSFAACVDQLDQLNKLFPADGPAFSLATNKELESMGLLQGFSRMIHCHLEGTLHPGLMMLELHKKATFLGVELLLGLTVTNIQSTAQAVHLRINGQVDLPADQVIIATNGFTKQLMPSVEVTAVRNQVIVTHPLAKVPFRGCFHYDQGYVYFRNIENRILLGGARNKFEVDESTDQFGVNPAIVEHLIHLLREIIPEEEVVIASQWSGILGIGAGSKMPIIEWHNDRILLACRMGGMGIAMGAKVGDLAAQRVAQVRG
ncbi:MAG: FAD-binding oxidoreductase [Saprospiraceae bacterium]|nr:FAD-binding oxidoreductase [Saprospiraceae bacterium]